MLGTVGDRLRLRRIEDDEPATDVSIRERFGFVRLVALSAARDRFRPEPEAGVSTRRMTIPSLARTAENEKLVDCNFMLQRGEKATFRPIIELKNHERLLVDLRGVVYGIARSIGALAFLLSETVDCPNDTTSHEVNIVDDRLRISGKRLPDDMFNIAGVVFVNCWSIFNLKKLASI